MSLEDIIISRRTHHHFSGAKVNQEVVNKSIELATWAPNHKLTHPWIFYDLGPESRTRLIQLAVELKKQKNPTLSKNMEDSLRLKLGSASHMLMIGLKVCDDEFQFREDYAAVSCGVQNMSLYIHDQGFGSKWSTAGFTRHEETYKILGAEYSEVEFVGCLLVGGVPEKGGEHVPPRPQYKDIVKCRP